MNTTNHGTVPAAFSAPSADCSLIPHVSRPGRYLGCEYNSITPAPATDLLQCVLVFPDLYEIGMSHQGLQILYHLLNARPQLTAERSYCPAPDAEDVMRRRSLPLVSLESGRPLADFDLIGITLPHELCYTNILTILDRAGLPFLAQERHDGQPIVVGGGAGAFNPEPVAEVFDAILLGDGEEAIIEIAETILRLRRAGAPRHEIVEALAAIAGVYLPHRYQPIYDENNRLTGITHAPETPPRVRRRVLADLDTIDHLFRPLVPNAKIVHDRLGIEIARGCTRGCRFCQAGITYRPVRERSVEQICTLAETGIAASGFDEIALLSLSSGDYSCLPEVLPQLMDRFAGERVSLSMPSMRVGTLGPELMEQIKRVRKTGFTLAPEAGSERLRQAINKGISEADLLDTVTNAFALGWNLIKLYFMIGLPGETDDDIDAIIELAKKAAVAGNVGRRGRRRVNVSIGTFVPKPHTPFQWEEQLDIAESRRRIDWLRAATARTGLNLKYHDPEQSFLEGVFSRGDRRLLPLIIAAWQQGARLDSWNEFFDLSRWREAAATCGIDLDGYLRGRNHDSRLPWQHLDTGVDPQFLLAERDRASRQVYTPDCRYHACQKCGLCDFRTIQPIVRNRALQPPAAPSLPVSRPPAPLPGCTYLITYRRGGPISYLGHLEFMQVILRAIRRAGLKPHYSQGFNPTPKVSFGPALPVGTESDCELLLLEHNGPIADLDQLVARLNSVLPAGVVVTAISGGATRLPQHLLSCYEITLPFVLDDAAHQAIDTFNRSEVFIIERERKGTSTALDVRPLVHRLSAAPPTTVFVDIAYQSGKPGCKPLELLDQILHRETKLPDSARVRKTAWRPL